MIAKFVVRTQEFILRFKCGYEKMVSCDALMELLEESEAFICAKKVKVVKSFGVAKREWTEVGSPKGKLPTAEAQEDPMVDDGNADESQAALIQNLAATQAMEIAQQQAIERKNKAREAQLAAAVTGQMQSNEHEHQQVEELALQQLHEDNARMLKMREENAHALSNDTTERTLQENNEDEQVYRTTKTCRNWVRKTHKREKKKNAHGRSTTPTKWPKNSRCRKWVKNMPRRMGQNKPQRKRKNKYASQT